MNRIYKNVKKASMGVGIILAIILIGASIFLAMYESSDVIKAFSAKEYVDEIPASKLKGYDYYKLSAAYLLEWYGDDDEGRYYIMETQGDNDELAFIGVFINEKDFEVADAAVEEYWQWAEGGYSKDFVPTKYLIGNAYVYDMGDLEKQYFDEMLDSIDPTGGMKEKAVYKTAVLLTKNDYVSSVGWFWVIISVVLFIIGVVLLIDFITGGPKRGFNKRLREAGIAPEALEMDMQFPAGFKGLDIGNRYSIVYEYSSKVIKNEDIIWAYTSVEKTTHKLYGIIPTGTTTSYGVVVVTRDNKDYKISIKKEEEGSVILRAFEKVAPYALYGFDDRIQIMRTQDFREVVNLVDRRAQEQEC